MLCLRFDRDSKGRPILRVGRLSWWFLSDEDRWQFVRRRVRSGLC